MVSQLNEIDKQNSGYRMDDVWDETGTENDVISMTSAKHENHLKTAAFKTALDETDTETFLQQGFNEGFKEAAIKFRALGKCKVCLIITRLVHDNKAKPICTAIRPSSKIMKVSLHRNKVKPENFESQFAPQ